MFKYIMSLYEHIMYIQYCIVKFFNNLCIYCIYTMTTIDYYKYLLIKTGRYIFQLIRLLSMYTVN